MTIDRTKYNVCVFDFTPLLNSRFSQVTGLITRKRIVELLIYTFGARSINKSEKTHNNIILLKFSLFIHIGVHH